ncbi:MAG: hypothetical protein COT31_01115 [Candidatus Moranbacteria bacterium CG08_land_8_20_14_0_20_34_16]|nr:MAG: hypothetical protein COT31_01115 [Candidatus Moranbacteria bacterium CG08_land_8_20_14_0_20_34_16]
MFLKVLCVSPKTKLPSLILFVGKAYFLAIFYLKIPSCAQNFEKQRKKIFRKRFFKKITFFIFETK